MVDAHHLDGMVEMGHCIKDGGLTILAQETRVEGYLTDAVFLGKGPHLVVGKVARMVAQGTTGTVTAYDGLGAQLQGIVET